MIRVVIESPFGRNVDGSKCTPEQYARNVRYLNRALLDSIRRGEAPYASHRFYPGLLDDTNPADRALGMQMGLVWSEAAQCVAVYQDHGITEGMRAALAQHAARPSIEIEFRSIGAEPGSEPVCRHCLEPVSEDVGVEGPHGDLWHQACLDSWRDE